MSVRLKAGGGDRLSGLVTFPPRNEPVDFGNQLNGLYRDTLRRGAVSTFVDLEGFVVWIQEYLRYRVNGCTQQDAIARVFSQIRGGGVLPVCAEAPAGSVAFPPRDQSLDFGSQLNGFYRDSLEGGSVPTFVDLEGWIVWIQEYLRYRVNNCGHADSISKVFTQINGGGIQPVCVPPTPTPTPTPAPAPGGAFIQIQGGSNACSCWIGTITVQIDGATVGTLSCTSSNTFQVSPGTHTVKASDATGSASGTVTVEAGATSTISLTCGALAPSQRLLATARGAVDRRSARLEGRGFVGLAACG